MPPQALGVGVKMEVTDPLIKQSPLKPLLYDNEPADGTAPHATIIPVDVALNVA